MQSNLTVCHRDWHHPLCVLSFDGLFYSVFVVVCDHGNAADGAAIAGIYHEAGIGCGAVGVQLSAQFLFHLGGCGGIPISVEVFALLF